MFRRERLNLSVNVPWSNFGILAAWANGTKAHALDYDDYFTPDHSTPYHPTVAISPAVLAVGEEYYLSGKDALLAYVTGFEIEARIATVCAQQQYDLG